MTHLKDLIERAVRKKLAAGAEAVLLSGGIDSSTVASFAPELPVVTGWYDVPGFDEREYAALVAKGREWLQVEVTPTDFVECFDATADALAGLVCGPGAVGQFAVAKALAKAGYGFVLSGEGGDELFGGYVRQHIVAGLPVPDTYRDYRLPDGYPENLPAALEYEWEALHELCAVDDRVNAANGVRVEPPLLDAWVVAHAFSLPVHQRIQKGALRKAMRGTVPDRILDRTDKRGFPAPYVQWAQEEPVRSFVEARIGYVPDPERPWDRQWWYDMLNADRAVLPRNVAA
jgi:asparagine synthetase B (glutamine-hydrolysing)